MSFDPRPSSHRRKKPSAVGPAESRSRGVGLFVTAASLASLALASVVTTAHAAPPFDSHSTAKTDKSQQVGYELTDPSQLHGSKNHWVGSYATFGSTKPVFCASYYYDFPKTDYHYTEKQAASIPYRKYSNPTVSGTAAARVAWLVNTHTTIGSHAEMAAVAAAINLIENGSAYRSSYTKYFAPQLNKINPAITKRVSTLLSESSEYAGPDKITMTFAKNPVVGTESSVTVKVTSASGHAINRAHLKVSLHGGTIAAGSSEYTDSKGVDTIKYRPTSTSVSGTASDGSSASTKFSFGYSPTHNSGSNVRTGAQWVVFRADHPTVPINAAAKVTAAPAPKPSGSTRVVGGNQGRRVGAPVADLFTGSHFIAGATYSYTATLYDSTGKSCGSVSGKAKATSSGALSFTTPTIKTCGTGKDTFAETVKNSAGVTVATTPKNVPAETFPVLKPSGSTTIVGGNGSRPVGTPVADIYKGVNFTAGAVYSYSATLSDSAGVVCGTVTGTATASSTGALNFTTPTVASCGTGRDTFSETVTNSTGTTVATTPKNVPAETFPIGMAGSTQVVGGNAARPIGAPVADTYSGSGFTAGAVYSYSAQLSDSKGQVCGTVTGNATASASGLLTFTTPTIATCGTGTDTFSETVKDTTGAVVSTTPKGVPSETFPVTGPSGQTAVVGGNGSRPVGTSVADIYKGINFLPGAVYSYTATLSDTSGSICGTVTGKATASASGALTFTTPTVKTCGSGTDTFSEVVKNSAGLVLSTTPKGVPSETFPIGLAGQTALVGGSKARPIGAPVADTYRGTGFVRGATYTYAAYLTDSKDKACGTVTGKAVAGPTGELTFTTPTANTCGTGTDTFHEVIKNSLGVIVSTTGKNVPSETFPILTPSGHTHLVGGTTARVVGTPVADFYSGTGFLPGATYTYTAYLTDTANKVCGTVTGKATATASGALSYTTPTVASCGTGKDTFNEVMKNSAGLTVSTTPKGVPAETFPITTPVTPTTPASAQGGGGAGNGGINTGEGANAGRHSNTAEEAGAVALILGGLLAAAGAFGYRRRRNTAAE